MGAGGAIGLDLHVRPANLARQGFAMRQGTRTGSGQPKVEHVDTKALHQMEDLDLLLNGRIADRRRLQPVAQRFVIQQDLARRYHRAGVDGVPVVNEISNFGSHFALTPVFHPTRAKPELVGDPVSGAPRAEALGEMRDMARCASDYRPNAGHCLAFSSPGLAFKVNPKMDCLPRPATFLPRGSSSLGRYNVLQCSQR